MKKISIGITGSSGSLGKELLKFKEYRFIKYKGDIRSKNKIRNWFKMNKFDAIFHLAAIVPIIDVNSNKEKAYDVNYIGTKNIVDEVKIHKIKWFFFSSTSHVYASNKNKISEKSICKPISYYGYTKKKSEDYIIKNFKKSNIKYCIGRIYTTKNINQKKNYLIPDLKKKIQKSKKNIILKNLNHYRDFISMTDISKIIFFLFRKNFKGIVNLGTGKEVHLKKIGKIIAKKYRKKISFDDNKIPTFLIANINKLRKIYKSKINLNLENKIF